MNVNRGVGYGRGAVAVGEEGAVAVGRRGAVAVGEEGFVGVGRHGAVVGGERYESYEGWRVAAGVATGIAVGTMLARPPRAATTVVVSGSNYMYADGAYYEQVMYGGQVSYRVVTAPAGAIITTLPGGCTTTIMGGVSVQQCGTTYYQRVSTGYRVVVYQCDISPSARFPAILIARAPEQAHGPVAHRVEHRTGSNASAHVLPVGVLLIGGLVYWSPILVDPAGRIAGGNGDPLFLAYIVTWVAGHFGDAALWNPPFFHPATGVLAYSDHLFGLSAVAWPLVASGASPIFVINLLAILASVLTSVALYIWLRDSGFSAVGAGAAALTVTYSAWRHLQISHPQLQWLAFLPIALLCYGRAIEGPGGRRVDLGRRRRAGAPDTVHAVAGRFVDATRHHLVDHRESTGASKVACLLGERRRIHRPRRSRESAHRRALLAGRRHARPDHRGDRLAQRRVDRLDFRPAPLAVRQRAPVHPRLGA